MIKRRGVLTMRVGNLPDIYRWPTTAVVCWVLLVGMLSTAPVAANSLRFFGNGDNQIDRVKIPIDPDVPVDVGATDFTIEFWMRAPPGENNASPCNAGPTNNWIFGNIVIDRDIWGAGQTGDYVISLFTDGLAFGVWVSGGGDRTICGDSALDDNQWHHIAVTRRLSDGRMQLYIDGQLEAADNGPLGDVSYLSPGQSDDDPFIVLAAEKHDADPPLYPSYSGWMAELRFSTVLRYAGSFLPPTQAFTTDPQTVGLYHFDEGSGNVVGDSSGAPGGPSDGVRNFGGSPAGPLWSAESPFGAAQSSLQFDQGAYSIDEDGGSATISVARNGDTSGVAAVDYASSDGSAMAGADYTSVNGTLNWAAGDGTPKAFNVSIIDDADAEGDETVSLTMSNPAGASISGTNPVDLTIFANDQPIASGELHFSSAAYSAGEASGMAALMVNRSNGSTGVVSIDYNTADGSAQQGMDYVAQSNTLTWADNGSTPQAINVPVTDDSSDEGDESFTVNLVNPTGGATSGMPAIASVTILDDDDPPSPGSLQLSVAALTVGEGANANLMATRTGGTDGAVTADYATIDGTATAGQDYSAAMATLSWADGDSGSRAITVTTLQDADDENQETFSVALSNLTGNATAGAPGSTTVSIDDDDAPPGPPPTPPADNSSGGGTLALPFLLTLWAFGTCCRRRRSRRL